MDYLILILITAIVEILVIFKHSVSNTDRETKKSMNKVRRGEPV